MPLYTFHSFRADGSPVALDSQELPGEREARACARWLLAEHRSADHVLVYLDEAEVLTVRRPHD